MSESYHYLKAPMPIDIHADLKAKIADLNESLAIAEQNDVIVDLHIKKQSLDAGIDSNPVLVARITQRI